MFDSFFLITAQSSILLGLIHGINPCGHSWLIIAPFVTGTKDGKKAFLMTAAFLLGTTVACLLIGLTLGAVSMMIPDSLTALTNYFTAGLIIVLGLILIVKPHLLHHHEHDHHDNDHNENSHHEHKHCGCDSHGKSSIKKWWSSVKSKISLPGLFLIGFVNMIIPCPTVSIMYKYAVDSGSYINATAIFGLYAITTAITVGAVIFVIYKATRMFYLLQKPWIESAVMRTAGSLTVFFGVWSII